MLALSTLSLSFASSVVLTTFDGAPTSHRWQDMNDPVMGGQSHSSFDAGNATSPVGIFQGKCAIVPSLKAPGFCKVGTYHGLFAKPNFADASAFIDGGLLLSVRSSTPEYKGFRVAFAAKNVTRPRPGMHHAPPSFKAGFEVAAGSKFQTVRVPFSSFSVDWSEFTGRCDTKDPTGEQHVCCSAANREVCPTAQHLSAITSLEVWAEGVEGDFELEIKNIAAGK